jgi:hypothetical protein
LILYSCLVLLGLVLGLSTSSRQRVHDGVVSRLGLVRGIVRKRGAFAGEDVGNPGDGVVELPNGNTGTELVVDAGVDSGRVIDSLSGQTSRVGVVVGIDVDPDIELGQRDLETEVGELLHGSGDVLSGVSSDKVGFET